MFKVDSSAHFICDCKLIKQVNRPLRIRRTDKCTLGWH